jgi:alkanesulfonate monooxygenase SsuD/methylene tetrahydromethanopterin reductase-like flavin-dependent oxidoreductase (luciferase family)
VRLAEEATVVDLLSDGRLDLGLGAGYRVPEYELYGADPTKRYKTTDERARELRRIWDGGLITPAPVQKRIPIWMGYLGPQGARRAGLLGEHLLSVDPNLWGPYRQGLVDGGHDPATARMAGGIIGWITEDPEGTWPIVSKQLAYKFDSYRRHTVEGTTKPVPKPVDPEKLRRRDPGAGLLRYFMHTTPEDAAARIKEYVGDEAPVEAVHIVAPLAGMPETMVLHHVQTICTRLAPLLAEA